MTDALTINSAPSPLNTSSIMLVHLNDQIFQPIFLNISLDTSPRERPIDRITTEEVIIVAIVMGLWCWACTLFYIRYKE